MIHLGDITKISGYNAPIVDCVVGGSPCQDLSVAGKRAGLDGERSGLFMEQLRIIKEMRDNDVRRNGRSGVAVRPRYMVWENVPGAFSSNKGEDFRVVLEETAKIADKDANVPMPDTGKWQTSGCIVGDGWSIAWRVLDAQFWGVPQRRRRIALVADFGGQSAPEILFVRKSVSRDIEQSQSKGKATSTDAEGSVGATGFDGYNGVIERGGVLDASVKSGTLSCVQDQYLFQPVYSVENHPADSRVDIDESGKVQTLTSRMGTGGGNVPLVMEQTVECVIALDRASYNQGKNAQFDIGISESGTAQSLVAKGPGAVCYTPTVNCQYGTRYIVRRLTPLECERLQGYPDGWTDIGEWVDTNGKKRQTSDAARYKALGNSIAIPPWKWVMKRLCACYERDATLASLFDGIGGFPYIWEQINGKGSCLWASEIEEFPIAVTKVRLNL